MKNENFTIHETLNRNITTSLRFGQGTLWRVFVVGLVLGAGFIAGVAALVTVMKVVFGE